LAGDVINGNPEGGDKNQCKVKFSVEFNRNPIPKFDWFDINFPVNVK
jgi:hypothetical protein